MFTLIVTSFIFYSAGVYYRKRARKEYIRMFGGLFLGIGIGAVMYMYLFAFGEFLIVCMVVYVLADRFIRHYEANKNSTNNSYFYKIASFLYPIAKVFISLCGAIINGFSAIIDFIFGII